MRTYIFTDLEREILKAWLNEKVTSKDIRLRKILSRIRLFEDLSSDIELYITVRSRLAEPTTA